MLKVRLGIAGVGTGREALGFFEWLGASRMSAGRLAVFVDFFFALTVSTLLAVLGMNERVDCFRFVESAGSGCDIYRDG